MFPNLNKPAFGTGTANSSFGFGSSASVKPFCGQNQLFGKPAGSTVGGATPAFGQTSGSSLFPGNQQQSGGLFQSSTPSFGPPPTGQTVFGTNVFGGATQQAAGGNIFGGAGFGQQGKSGGFGFGATSGQSSIFGQSQPPVKQTILPFQASTSSSLYGGGAFKQTGTVMRFQPITSTDTMQKSGVTTTINTKHYCITCMKEYEGKSLEELRWEDYQANRKGPKQPGFGAAPFSSVGSSVPMFGQQQVKKPLFGQSSGGFGGGFPMGGQDSTPQSIFGKPTTTTNAFGFGTSTLSTSSPFSKFGTTTSQPLLGAGTQQTPSFGTAMFSQQQNPSILSKPPTTTAFGTGAPTFSFAAQPTSQTSNLFSASKPITTLPASGQPKATTPVFIQQQPAFGQSAQPAFGQISQPAFGQTSQPAFDASTLGKQATGLGQTAQTAFGTGLGMQQSSLFSSLSKPAENVFAPSTGTDGFFTTNNMQPQNNMMVQQPQQSKLLLSNDKQNEDYKMALLIADQFGQPIQLSHVIPEDRRGGMSRITRPEDIEKLLTRPTSPPPTNLIKPKMMAFSYHKRSIFDGLAEEMAISSASMMKPRRRLVLKDKDKDMSPVSSSLVIEEEQPTHAYAATINNTSKISAYASPINDSTVDQVYTKDQATSPEQEFSFYREPTKAPSPPEPNKTKEKESQTNTTESTKNGKLLLLPTNDAEGSFASTNTSTSTSDEYDTPLSDMSEISIPVVNLQRPQYYTIPSLEILEKLRDDDGKCYVKGFTVGRDGYGNVCFPDTMDVSGLNLDELVHLRHREVVVYPDDSMKPPQGQGLNRRAQVTFDGVYPVMDGQTIKKPEGPLVLYFTETLREVCDRKGMRFFEYRPETGSFVFGVDHFSKYGLDNKDISVDTRKYRNKWMEDLQ